MNDLISRKAAIEAVHKTIYGFFDIVDDDSEEPFTKEEERFLVINKAITTRIKSLPSAQPCDTCRYSCLKWDDEPCDGCHGDHYKPMVSDCDGTLTVTVPQGTEVRRVLVEEEGAQFGGMFYPDERKRGKWYRAVLCSTSGYGTTVMYQCSNCENMAISEYRFCPNCGSYNGGGEDEQID